LQFIMQVVAADVCASRILPSANAADGAPIAAMVRRIAKPRMTACASHARAAMIPRSAGAQNAGVASTPPPPKSRAVIKGYAVMM